MLKNHPWKNEQDLKGCLEFVKRNNPNFNPFIILAAGNTDHMAKYLHEQLYYPAIGFTGSPSSPVLLHFTVNLTQSFLSGTSLESTFKSGVLGIRILCSSADEKQHALPKLFARPESKTWMESLSNFIFASQHSSYLSLESSGFWKWMDGNSITIKNNTLVDVELNIKTHGEFVPPQKMGLPKGQTTEIYIGNNGEAKVTVYSKNNGKTILHVIKLIPNKYTFTISDRHLSQIYEI